MVIRGISPVAFWIRVTTLPVLFCAIIITMYDGVTAGLLIVDLTPGVHLLAAVSFEIRMAASAI